MKTVKKILVEPKIDYQMPHVYKQPKLNKLQKGKLHNIENNIIQARKYFKLEKGKKFSNFYNKLTAEYQPLINWAIKCWDYLLTKLGCRFFPRPPADMPFYRGDYKAFRKDEFRSLVYTTFKLSTLKYYPLDGNPFSIWLKNNFWKKVFQNYDSLKYPPDKKQRKLTSYSYLRCVPYNFLNDYHQKKVNSILDFLSPIKKSIIYLYYLKFYKDEIIKKEKGIAHPYQIRKDILGEIANLDYLVYALLLQIERY